jgi:hypothetical protein
LLEPSLGSSQYITVREVDRYIHQLFYECQTHCSYKQHISHQRDILELVRDCERQIFNDPTVVYATRPHLTGQYGTMSNILTSYYFYLYKSLLHRGVKIATDHDCTTIFCLLLQVDPTSIPICEKKYIRQILRYIRQKDPTLKYFDRLWWNHLINVIDTSIKRGMSSSFYQDPANTETAKKIICLGILFNH